MPVTMFKESRAFRINKKIRPKQIEELKRIFFKKILIMKGRMLKLPPYYQDFKKYEK